MRNRLTAFPKPKNAFIIVILKKSLYAYQKKFLVYILFDTDYKFKFDENNRAEAVNAEKDESEESEQEEDESMEEDEENESSNSRKRKHESDDEESSASEDMPAPKLLISKVIYKRSRYRLKKLSKYEF